MGLQEVLRMYPPVAIGQLRVCYSHDITLAGRLHIPAGTIMWMPHHAIQNASFNWDDADKFIPGALPAGSLHRKAYSNQGLPVHVTLSAYMVRGVLCGCNLCSL